MKSLLFVVLSLAVFTSVARGANGYVQLGDGVSRYVEYQPAKPGFPTVVMVNGLVYATDRWNTFRGPLAQKGYGLLNYDFRGQRFTLRREVEERKTPAFFKDGLDSRKMAEELQAVLQALRMPGPLVLVGLSYGAHIAAEFARLYPAQVHTLIFMAPLVIPLDNYNPQGRWILANLDFLRLTWGPVFGPMFYEAAYAQIYRSYYQQQLVPDRIPEELRAFPNEYRESIFHLTRAVRDFDLRRYDFAAPSAMRVYFLTAGKEDPNAFRDQLEAFDRVAPSARGVLVHFPESGHAIPDSVGPSAAGLLDVFLTRDARLRPGGKYRMTEQGLELWNGPYVVSQNPAR